jgi:hypothetical protein
MAEIKQVRTRITRLPGDYNYEDWSNTVLTTTLPSIDYFKFAATFGDFESATDHHSADMFTKLATCLQ